MLCGETLNQSAVFTSSWWKICYTWWEVTFSFYLQFTIAVFCVFFPFGMDEWITAWPVIYFSGVRKGMRVRSTWVFWEYKWTINSFFLWITAPSFLLLPVRCADIYQSKVTFWPRQSFVGRSLKPSPDRPFGAMSSQARCPRPWRHSSDPELDTGIFMCIYGLHPSLLSPSPRQPDSDAHLPSSLSSLFSSFFWFFYTFHFLDRFRFLVLFIFVLRFSFASSSSFLPRIKRFLLPLLLFRLSLCLVQNSQIELSGRHSIPSDAGLREGEMSQILLRPHLY